LEVKSLAVINNTKKESSVVVEHDEKECNSENKYTKFMKQMLDISLPRYMPGIGKSQNMFPSSMSPDIKQELSK
jgi:hypothetical protein